MPPKLFSFTLLSKNASANHLVSHSCKNKGLKVSCFHTLTKKGVGEGGRISCFDFRVSSPNFRLSTLDCQLSRVSPLDSALTFFLSANPLASTLTGFALVKSFTSNTYEKHTQGEGVGACFGSEHKSRVTNHESRVTDHAPQSAMVHSCRPLIGEPHD